MIALTTWLLENKLKNSVFCVMTILIVEMLSTILCVVGRK